MAEGIHSVLDQIGCGEYILYILYYISSTSSSMKYKRSRVVISFGKI